MKDQLREALKDAWSDGPQGLEWVVYTVAGVLLYKAIKYLVDNYCG
jgi:hypothetical protein